jgi:GH25 family lysozyme M1 (1,4-beta-N-acetylmuramidase)
MARKIDDTQVPGRGLTDDEAAPALVATPAPRILGIDVSDYQIRVDYDAVRKSGRRFVYIKVTEGNGWKAKLYDHHKEAALKAGLYVGGYHFARPDDSAGDARAEAQLMIQRMGPRAREEMPPVLDLEATKTKRTASWMREFCEEIHSQLGEIPTVYLGQFFLGPQSGAEQEALDWLGKNTRLMLPAYPGHTIDPLTYAQPKAFASWAEVTIHQYSGDATGYTGNATIPGVVGFCDACTFWGTERELIAYAEAG